LANAVGVYKVCVKAIDNAGNYSIISGTIEIEKIDYTYEQISANYSCANTKVGSSPIFTYNGNCSLINDNNGNWRIKFTSTGTLTVNGPMNIDIFVVGGGGGNAGGGGYTNTYTNVFLSLGSSHYVNIGNGGASGSAGGKSYFSNSSTYYANGGNAGVGGSGGSGGGRTTSETVCTDMWWNSQTGASCNAWGTNYTYGTGGSYGNSGGNGGGSGQGRTTCEFSQGSTSGCNSNVVAYGGGGSTSSSGSAGGGGASGVSGTTNTGGGGGANAAGGSGIVIIRNKR